MCAFRRLPLHDEFGKSEFPNLTVTVCQTSPVGVFGQTEPDWQCRWSTTCCQRDIADEFALLKSVGFRPVADFVSDWLLIYFLQVSARHDAISMHKDEHRLLKLNVGFERGGSQFSGGEFGGH